jgi:TRAP transporter TAXI family solute receptor
VNRLFIYAAAAATLIAAGADRTLAAEFITIGGGPTGGTYYAISTGMAKVFNAELKNIEARVRATSGGLENPVLASGGKIDIGPTNANLAVWAYEGSEVYKGKKQPNIALFMGGLAGGLLHIAVLADSPIKSIEDLKGKRVAVGPQGNTTALMMNQFLSMEGIAPSQYTQVYVNYNDGFSALGDGNVDAAIVNTAPPVAAVKELGIRHNIRLLSIPDEKRKAFLDKYPFYGQGRIAKAIYGTNEDISTVGTSNIIIVRKDMDANLVYDMIKAVYENLDDLRATHPSARAIQIENGPNGGLPLHPGSERYFRERGVLKQ